MTDRHEHLDEGTIHAWLDGELPPDESAKVESQAATCAECAALVAEARGLVAASSRILSSLDAVPGGVIPGTDAGADQLAALRARRRQTSRRWWNDRRIVAAASLVFVAGAASVVWRSAGNDAVMSRSEQVAKVAEPVADSATPVATAPVSPPAAVREAPARDARVAATAPLPDTAPARVAASRAPDSAAERTIATTDFLRRSAITANESRRTDSIRIAPTQQASDSARVEPRTAQLAVESQVQQGAGAQKQQALRQRVDQSRPAAPPSALGLSSVVTTGAGAAARAADARCYRLRLLPTQSGAPGVVVDSVQLLNEALPERSDPMWYRARAAGWTVDTALAWRSVDSTTVELRSRIAANPFVVRFSTTASGLPMPDVSREAGVLAALAIRCR